jgi:hypothetical protein
MALKTLLVMPILDATWRRDFELTIPPFVGLGIRLDTYDMVNVDSVVVGDHGYDVTCIVSVEGVKAKDVTEKLLIRLGFEKGVYV